MNSALRALLPSSFCTSAFCAVSLVACAPEPTAPTAPIAPEATAGGEQPAKAAEVPVPVAAVETARFQRFPLDLFVTAPAIDRDAKHLARLLNLQGPLAMAGLGLKPFAPMIIGATLAGALDLDQPLVMGASMQSLAEQGLGESEEGEEASTGVDAEAEGEESESTAGPQGVVVSGLRAGYEATLAKDYMLVPGPSEGTRLMTHLPRYVPPADEIELNCLVDDRDPARIACSDSSEALLAHHVEVIARSRAAMPSAILSIEALSSEWLQALMADEPEMLASLGAAQRMGVSLILKDEVELALAAEFDFVDRPEAPKVVQDSYRQMKHYAQTDVALPSLPALPKGLLAAFVTRGASEPASAGDENVLNMALEALAEELPADSTVSAEMLSALKEMLLPWQAATGATFALGQKLNLGKLSKSGSLWGAMTVMGEGDKLIASIRDVIDMVNKVQGDCADKDCEFQLHQRAAPRRYRAPKGSVEVSLAVDGEKKAVMVLAPQAQGMALLASKDAKTVRKVLAGVLKPKGKAKLTPVQENALTDALPDQSVMMAGFVLPEVALSLATFELETKEDRAEAQEMVATVAKFESAPVKLSSNGKVLDDRTIRTSADISFAISSLRVGAAMAADAMAE